MKKASTSKSHAAAMKHLDKACHHNEKAKQFMDKADKEAMKKKSEEKTIKVKRKKAAA